ADGQPHALRFDDASLAVSVTSEAGKLDLNAAPVESFARLVLACGGSREQSADLSQALNQRRGVDLVERSARSRFATGLALVAPCPEPASGRRNHRRCRPCDHRTQPGDIARRLYHDAERHAVTEPIEGGCQALPGPALARMKHLSFKRLAPLQARLHSQWRGSRAQQLWQAWLNELQALLPASVRARLLPQVRERLIDWPLPVPIDERHDERVVLVLPASMMLVQTLLLPTAAVRDLHNVIGFELDKYTPYPRDQMQYVARVIGKEGALAQVMLVAVLRERLQPALDACQAQGLALHA
nr:hypothetical protein [Tanacetum cinerariifolium]